ncbi:MAG: NAD(P)/FAD-dependent oxidoreductase [Clostridiales bacterium]|nr:NAD(P)/FAD-dependent oxidoreductase [Clostridiales bacterium]
MSKVAVVGGGAAGMMAACAAGAAGHAVTLFEHNEKLGKKIYITGKGRCNLTNACETEDFFASVPRNGKFLYSAVYQFDSRAVMDFFETQGLSLKTERGNRVFPQSDHASDVTKTLERAMHRADVKIVLGAEVTDIRTEDGRVTGLRYRRNDEITFPCDAVIMAAGGVSYPSTGSDGSGWELLKKLGHTCTDTRPSLVGLLTAEEYIPRLQGLSLKNIRFTVQAGTKKVYEEFGELLFTHQGVSGPVVLTASSVIPDRYFSSGLTFEIDLKPSLTEEQLDLRIQRDFAENVNRRFKNALGRLLPSKMIPVVIPLSGIDPEKKVNAVTKQERRCLLTVLKHFPGTITGTGGWNEAIITRGGIRVSEVNPSTMESRIVQGLYLCGEMLDLDALTGGFNLQIAWSTGHLAGASVR